MLSFGTGLAAGGLVISGEGEKEQLWQLRDVLELRV